jgi:hypothetical protein
MDLSQKTNGDLFALLASVMRELRDRKLIRTANNPVADLGELLFCGAMHWKRGDNQGKDIDATTQAKEKVQIKARRMTRDKDSDRSGTIYDKDGFDLVALAMFDPDFRIKRAIIIPRHIALIYLRWSNRQKGWYVSLTKAFWKEPELIDVTDRLARHCEEVFLRSAGHELVQGCV